MNPQKISATKAKLNFGALLLTVKGGTPVIIEKNFEPEMVCISIDDYEDFLEIKDKDFQKTIRREKI